MGDWAGRKAESGRKGRRKTCGWNVIKEKKKSCLETSRDKARHLKERLWCDLFWELVVSPPQKSQISKKNKKQVTSTMVNVAQFSHLSVSS